MQRGIATLEIIFGSMIIAVLVSYTISNVERVLDRAALDYETKRLYSELRFLQELGRSSSFNIAGTSRNDLNTTEPLFMQITSAELKYQIFRGNTPLREAHQMQNIIRIEFKKSVPSNRIIFDDTGQPSVVSNSLILTSRLGQKNFIKFDPVGRIRGSLTDEDD